MGSSQGIVFRLDVREVTFPGPPNDNDLFQTMRSVAFTFTPGVQLVSSALLSIILASGLSVPLATWVSWGVSHAGSTTPWGATFRVLVPANQVVRGGGRPL